MGIRGSGRTSTQMKEALHGAVFVWCVGFTLDYARRLAHHLGRPDLTVISPNDDYERYMGEHIILDHECYYKMTPRLFDRWQMVVDYGRQIRP